MNLVFLFFNTRPDMITLYFEEPDKLGHKAGPISGKVSRVNKFDKNFLSSQHDVTEAIQYHVWSFDLAFNVF